jgi:hypothetical protein
MIESYALGIDSENAAELSSCAPTFAPESHGPDVEDD